MTRVRPFRNAKLSATSTYAGCYKNTLREGGDVRGPADSHAPRAPVRSRRKPTGGCSRCSSAAAQLLFPMSASGAGEGDCCLKQLEHEGEGQGRWRSGEMCKVLLECNYGTQGCWLTCNTGVHAEDGDVTHGEDVHVQHVIKKTWHNEKHERKKRLVV